MIWRATAKSSTLAPRPITIHALRSAGMRAGLRGAGGRMRQGNLCARHRPRSRPRAGLLRPCHGAAPHPRRAVFRGRFHAPLAELLDAPDEAPDDMLGVEAGLTELPCIVLDRDGAARLRRGQSVILRGRDAPAEGCGLCRVLGGGDRRRRGRTRRVRAQPRVQPAVLTAYIFLIFIRANNSGFATKATMIG